VTRRIRVDLLETTLLLSLATGRRAHGSWSTSLTPDTSSSVSTCDMTYETSSSSPYVQHRPALAEACSVLLTSVMHDAQDSMALETWWRHWVEDDEYSA
jgi:hypothetical protein